jgi:hypothetical protein
VIPYLGRSIDLARPVRVYRCLHGRDGDFSVLQGGVVVAHTDSVVLLGARPVVSASGCAAIVRTGRKRVAAMIEGMIGHWPDDRSHTASWRFSKHDAAFIDGVGRRLLYADAVFVRDGSFTSTGAAYSEPRA